MKKIELFEKAIAEKAASLKEWGINPTLFWAYRNSITAGNDRIDFGEAIWDSEVGEITETLKENGITEFTISSTFSICFPAPPQTPVGTTASMGTTSRGFPPKPWGLMDSMHWLFLRGLTML